MGNHEAEMSMHGSSCFWHIMKSTFRSLYALLFSWIYRLFVRKQILIFLIFLHLTSLKLCRYCLNNIVWISYSFYRTPFNWLLVNLALADITFAVFQVPNHILTFTPSDVTIGSALCKVLTAGNVAWVGAAAGSITLVVIAFERYYTVRSPVSGKGKLTKNTVKVTEYKYDHNITVLKSSSEVYSL